MATAAAGSKRAYKQDLPPKGGYAPFNYHRIPARKMYTGIIVNIPFLNNGDDLNKQNNICLFKKFLILYVIYISTSAVWRIHLMGSMGTLEIQAR